MTAIRDTLTGLPGRDAFLRRLSDLCASKAEGSHRFSLAIIDIDHFKSVNDGFGHRRGDEILKEFGSRMMDISREQDLIFRYGGDEFTVLLPGADIHEAEVFTGRVLKSCSELPFDGDPPLSVTLSIGAAQFPVDGLSAREVFDSADRRVYIAKRKGRNCIVSTDDEPRHEGDVPDSRLLGRERELAEFMTFAREVAERGRGFFLVLGPDGAGKSRFLDAAASYLSLNEYRILCVEGGGETGSPCSDLSSALGCGSDCDSVRTALKQFTRSSVNFGAVLKDAHLIDPASMEILLEFSRDFTGWMAVAASTERPVLPAADGFGGISSSVRLGAVSLEDCRAWFRATHMWNPPDGFLEWFHTETAGLPGLFGQAVSHLERRGYLSGNGAGLTVENDYRDFALGSRITFSSTAEINNLPIDLTAFVGREKELELIRSLIDTGERLITLRGMSGMGCGRLAIRAAGQNEFMFPAGICMVDCGLEPGSVAARLASELSLPSGRNPMETVAAFIGDSAMLLVLTNTSRDHSLLVSGLVQSCAGITVIATGRSALELPGEAVVNVSGLSTTGGTDGKPSEAARVFLQTARRLAGTQETKDFPLPVIEEICLLLGGAPLAVELAASWTRVMSPAAICRRIRANPSFLGTDESDSERDGLSDIFKQSWGQLADSEKNAISRLTVFAGHFSVEEAEEISDTSPETVMSLVDRSFLARDDMGIHIPAMTRDFILQEQKGGSRGFEVAREMHCRHFAARAAAAGEMISSGREAARGLEGVRAVFEDLSLAWKLAIEKRRFRFLRQMLEPVCLYCLKKGRYRTGFSMMEEAAKGAGSAMPPGLHSLLLASQAFLAFSAGRAEDTDRLIMTSLNISGNLDDLDRGRVLYLAGTILLSKGVLDGAGEYLEKAGEIFRRTGSRRNVLETDLAQVEYQLLRGDYNSARKLLANLAERCRQNDFRRGEWETRLYMGLLARADGDLRRARESCLSYLTSVRSAGYTGSVAEVLNLMASIETELGNFNQAQQYTIASEDYFKRIGSTRGKAVVKLNTAFLSSRSAKDSEAVVQYSEALSLGEKVRDEGVVTAALTGLAMCFIRSGKEEKGRKFIQRAAEMASASRGEPVMIRVLLVFAELDLLEDRQERAAETALALLHAPAADAASHSCSMEILRKARAALDSGILEEKKERSSETSVEELMNSYTGHREQSSDTVYRKG